ncbi:N-acetylmuramoyl-L-alanine amidase [Streptomyces formicae]|uniref:N-acetylmuramoyl-L-alanine amidase n=1 Tax=Streptomyces formicae TaxID=1616117 RepID=A0ABY3WLJ5_9ACTN|nr:N-acetylmuramoyl-L-alanine amidase [Streptomyces formicae]UNM12339.1 N-acetylmuramoyl-L-alanine amidase [Streptomyces formicae]
MATPLSPDKLLAALKAEGLNVREYKSWRTHRRPASAGAFGSINGVMTHHTVTGPGTDVVALCYNGHASLPGPLCQGVIKKDGSVWLTSAGRSNHAGLGDADVLRAVIAEDYGDYPPTDNQANTDGNRHFYGFECENLGDGKDPWPKAQYVAMVKANAAILRAYGWTAKSAIAHKEWQPGKVDPAGIDMKKFRADIAACLKLPPGKWGVAPAPPAPKPALTVEQRLAALEKRVTTLESKVQ